MNITILCKVVDNFGDIGVVYRLVRRLRFIRPEVNINLVVDDLISFNKLNDKVSVDKQMQVIDGYEVYDWKCEKFCYETFSKNDGEKLEIILECFQCGRPDWMEKILFEDKLNRIVNIIMIDYLTAESYAEDFHCLNSLTRSSKVKKVNFMPGFTEKTGGLTLEEDWENLTERNNKGPVLIFTYEQKSSSFVNAINNSGIKKAVVAQGRGLDSVMKAAENLPEKKCSFETLPYLNQTEWDRMMRDCSILFIRGEESMSRACLLGIPFVWHAYPQSDEYQLVKVKALLERMKRHFKFEDFECIYKVWIDFNTDVKELNESSFEKNIRNFINKADDLEYGFRDFAVDLRKNGDLATNLMTFIEKNIIIEK